MRVSRKECEGDIWGMNGGLVWLELGVKGTQDWGGKHESLECMWGLDFRVNVKGRH